MANKTQYTENKIEKGGLGSELVSGTRPLSLYWEVMT